MIGFFSFLLRQMNFRPGTGSGRVGPPYRMLRKIKGLQNYDVLIVLAGKTSALLDFRPTRPRGPDGKKSRGPFARQEAMDQPQPGQGSLLSDVRDRFGYPFPLGPKSNSRFHLSLPTMRFRHFRIELLFGRPIQKKSFGFGRGKNGFRLSVEDSIVSMRYG